MEKTAINEARLMGSDVLKGALERVAEKRRQDHVRIWREILRDVRRQWVEAERNDTRYGRK